MDELGDFIDRLDQFVPGISLDCVLLGFRAARLHVLLAKWKGAAVWSLPGGFLEREETLEQAATRVLRERTGVHHIFLNQFHTFSDPQRSWTSDQGHHGVLPNIFHSQEESRDQRLKDWFAQRFVTTGFLALVDINQVHPVPDPFSERCVWTPVEALPPLVLDHQTIIAKALEKLRIQLNYLPIGISLLPEQFTMKALQQLYEAILESPLDRSNFQRKMLALGILERQEKLMTGAANKAPYLYRFKEQEYRNALEKGIGLPGS